jgi:hypothetical protein
MMAGIHVSGRYIDIDIARFMLDKCMVRQIRSRNVLRKFIENMSQTLPILLFF